MNNTARRQKQRQFMMLLNRLGIDNDQRHQLVFAWTNGRTSSSRELTDNELADLVLKLQNDMQTANTQAIIAAHVREKRSVVLAIAQRCGIHSGTSFDRFNRFMLERSILKKELRKYTLTELDELIKQFRGIERNYNTSAANPGTKAWSHAHGWGEMSDN
jgi:predicted DNA binding protein